MKILIISLSRSGSTALLFQILAAMPPESKYAFEPNLSDFRDHLGSDDLVVKCIIDQLPAEDLKNLAPHFDRKIIIIRDPRDRLISAFLYSLHGVGESELTKRLEILEEKRKSVKTISFISLVQKVFPSWSPDRIREYIGLTIAGFIQLCNEIKPRYLLHYEDLVDKGWGSLGDHLSLNEPIDYFIPNRYRYGKRRISPGDWRNWFTDEDVKFFQPLLTDFMARYGYEDDWQLSENPFIRMEHSTGFVKKAYEHKKLYNPN